MFQSDYMILSSSKLIEFLLSNHVTKEIFSLVYKEKKLRVLDASMYKDLVALENSNMEANGNEITQFSR